MTADICGAMAAACACTKEPGHVAAGDPVHACDPTLCTGQWTGEYDNSRFDGGRDWECVTLPMPVGSPS